MEDVFGVGKAVEKIVDPVMALLTRIAGPAADEIGLTLQDRIHVYRARQAYRLGEKFLAFCQQRKVEPRKVDLKLLFPIFDNASVEEDEDLRTMWANLLTSAADSKGGLILPSFAHTLKQLSKADAVFLLQFRNAVESRRFYPYPSSSQLIDLYSEIESNHSQQDLEIILDNVLRLGLIRLNEPVLKADKPFDARYPGRVQEWTIDEAGATYFVTEYGKRFLTACGGG